MKKTNEKINYKNQNGITVLVLLITILILLILTGITIDIAVDGRLFDNAQESANKVNTVLEEQNEIVQNLVTIKQNLENENEYIIQNEVDSRNLNYFTVSAKSMSPENHNLIYELWVSNAYNGTYTKHAESASTTPNTLVTLETGHNLTANTEYFWYIVVKDATDSELLQRSITKSVKTISTN